MKFGVTFSAFVLAAVALVGCGKVEPGAKYIGKWEETKEHLIVVNVRPNDGTYLVDITNPEPFSKRLSTKTFPGTIKDGFLRVAHDGIGDMTFAVDNASGHLTGAGFEFVKTH